VTTTDSVPDAVELPLLEPSGGVPSVLNRPDEVAAAADAIAQGHGPVAIDAERASGYRYGQRAYLVQIKRAGSGSFLIDPIGLPDLKLIHEAIGSAEWILHAASQDLPCLLELGMQPTTLFDTELAGRIAGKARVGLGPLVEEVLGLRLDKGHGAADWSTRPLPDPWLRYAVLDVEVLIELRDALAQDLDDQGKTRWAHEEFHSIVTAPPPPPRVDPWRRVSGLHRVRQPQGLAIVRQMWQVRDEIAQQRDIAPGRILQDVGIVEAALAVPTTDEQLFKLSGFRGRGAQRNARKWLSAVATATALPADQWPKNSVPSDGPPPARTWADKNKEAALRLSAARHAVSILSDKHSIAVENLLTPDYLRRLCWTPPWSDDQAPDRGPADAFLSQLGARPWQRELVLEPVLEAIAVASQTGMTAVTELHAADPESP
jgi:ribonuclease D